MQIRIFGIPGKLHKEFRHKCIDSGQSMNRRIQDLMAVDVGLKGEVRDDKRKAQSK